ncbi:hypothetical protein SNE25_04630 [Mucilaginibacter sabulilitoris]|uniref:TerB family tellurite resistance protein n=1 Tax=Mucilaginibacter sabulilitoris TaxID=1173583 RepID=A0ABZ0TPV1_9SPHI|nr:hypothetical protein [Mucilaginibacter sabulilitoris]WPU94806.1 hypothetical protein SNE25_04630 [Mucilaginibacter sabulilitoris]
MFALGFVIIIGCFFGSPCQAQTFSEWFRQGSTQKKYLLQQIAALEVYRTYVKEGYQIAHSRLSSISGYLNTENTLHGNYYHRLDFASGAVKKNYQVREILDWQKDILKILKGINQIAGLTSAEKGYLLKVRKEILKDCDYQIDMLDTTISDGQAKMSDAERIILIANIHHEMLENYRFTAGFIAQAKVFGQQRLKESQDLRTSQQLYGLN